ncbi:MAG: hypothetical protein JSR93_06755 [Verrucomicrobia bacterium]|nr:hypothetical protein [Verrucomicrobiota bacterium]
MCNKAIDNIKYEIENISSQIALISCQEEMVGLLDLYNERGVRYFCIGLIKNAIDDFTHVLEHSQKTDDSLLALALWGRMLCYAYQNCEEEAIHDLNLFQSYFLSECSPCRNHRTVSANHSALKLNSSELSNEFQSEQTTFVNLATYQFSNFTNEDLNYKDYVFLIAEFANPDERISIEECRQRVKGTADIMRMLTARIPNASLIALVNLAISKIEDAMNSCCYKNHWTDCLAPIIDAYNYIKKCMDKGVAIAPNVIWSGR